MSKNDTSSIALFKQFQPKFRKVTWVPAGFKLLNYSGNFHFYPKTKASYTHYEYPCFDLKKSVLAFDFHYDPTLEVDPTSQMIVAAWKAILAGPFAGREFYADPKSLEGIFTNEYSRIVFSHDGDPIPGLDFSLARISADWKFFIPESPEQNAILAAIKLERAQRQEKQRRPDLDVLQTNLDSALSAAIPT
jgi:hypothetical protein